MSDLTVVGKATVFLFPKTFKIIRLMVFMYVAVPILILLALLYRIFTNTPDMETLWDSLKSMGKQFDSTYEHEEIYGDAGDWILMNFCCTVVFLFMVVASSIWAWG
jgi:hypothetical protein